MTALPRAYFPAHKYWKSCTAIRKFKQSLSENCIIINRIIRLPRVLRDGALSMPLNGMSIICTAVARVIGCRRLTLYRLKRRFQQISSTRVWPRSGQLIVKSPMFSDKSLITRLHFDSRERVYRRPDEAFVDF